MKNQLRNLILSLLLMATQLYADKPNILFAIADDWSFGHAGSYGCSWVKTPAFDRVASEGLLFKNAYTPNGKCSPSRSCIITGRNSWELGAAANHWPVFPPEYKSVVEALGEHNYFTGMTGKGWGPGTAEDEDGKRRQMTGKLFQKHKLKPPTKNADSNDYGANFNEFLDVVPKDEPWFFWYGSKDPHRPYEYGSGVAKGGKKLSDIEKVPGCWPDTEEVRNDMLDYAYEVEQFDHHLGQMLAELEKRGELDNTLVIVTSDNGMPFPHCKGYAYNNSNHLPLAIMWKNGVQHEGRVIDDYVSFIDFAPTFLEAAGVAQTDTGMAAITGRSLFEILTSEKSGQVIPERDHVLVCKERTDVGRPNDEGYPIRGIVKNGMLYLHNFETDRWPGGNQETDYRDTDDSPTKTAVLETINSPEQKRFFDMSFGKLPAEQLFDLSKDPDCVVNLASDPEKATVMKQLHEQLFDGLKAQDDPRMFGQGHLFDEYPNDSKNHGLFEKLQAKGKAPNKGKGAGKAE
ncbi:MAG: sulfatase family protein [Luteolibacter sp.]